MTYAVVHADEGLVPQDTQRPGRDGDRLERRAHAGAFGVADAVYIFDGHSGFAEGSLDEISYMVAVVFRSVLWKEAFARWGNKCVADVGQDLGRTTVLGVKDQPNAEFVGGAFEAEGYHDEN